MKPNREILTSSKTIYVAGTRGIPDVQGGIERHCEELYTRVQGVDLNIIVFTRSQYNVHVEKWQVYRGTILRKTWSPKSKYFEAAIHTIIAITLTKIYGGKKIHIHAIGPGLFTLYARVLGLKVFFTHHGFDYERTKWNKIAKYFLRLGERMAMRNAHTVFSVSNEICYHLQKVYRRKSFYLPNGINPQDLTFVDSSIRTLLTQYGLKENSYIIVVARLVPEKGIHILLDAFAMGTFSFSIVIVGEADYETEYSKSLKARIGPKILFFGKQNHKTTIGLISKARALVLPSFHEGLPIVLLEALALKTFTIASNIVANKEIIGESEYGLLFLTGNAVDLNNKLTLLDSLHKKEIGKITEKAYKMILDKYNWDNNVKIFRKIVIES